MPVKKGLDCVGDEMRRFKQGALHSGKGGKVVTDPRQAQAIALSACGDSQYVEVLSSLGFSEETASLVVEIFAESLVKASKHSSSSPSFDEPDWQKQFETGKAPAKENPENYKTGKAQGVAPGSGRISKTGVKGDNNKNKTGTESEMMGPGLYPKGPGDPMSGSSKEVFGLRALG
jgi:hypothetical protein